MPNIPCFWVERREDGTWVRPDTGEVKEHVTDFGNGALWDAPWMRPEDPAKSMCKVYPDGLTMVVMTPGGDWLIDGPAYNTEKGHYACPWTRTGDPKNPKTFSVTPSINMPGRYHGWLTKGVLSDA